MISVFSLMQKKKKENIKEGHGIHNEKHTI